MPLQNHYQDMERETTTQFTIEQRKKELLASTLDSKLNEIPLAF